MTIKDELERRLSLWSELQALSPAEITPAYARAHGIYGGMQGIWVDKARTVDLTHDGVGATVSILHTGQHYADDLSEDGIIYHYPRTKRSGGRDAGEIQATKNAAIAALPVFVLSPGRRTGERKVRLSWVVDHDDTNRQFLLLFGGEPPTYSEPVRAAEPFNLFSALSARTSSVRARAGQQRFRFQVLKQYGAKCSACDIRHEALLKAAHICGKANRGSDDWRNGLPLCATHHDAFDAHLFGIEPVTLRLIAAPGVAPASIGVSERNLAPLARSPHPEALEWRWKATAAKWA